MTDVHPGAVRACPAGLDENMHAVCPSLMWWHPESSPSGCGDGDSDSDIDSDIGSDSSARWVGKQRYALYG